MGAGNGASPVREDEARKNTHQGDLLVQTPSSRKSRREAAADATIARLAATFPRCFAVYQLRRRPLKVGIHHDIIVRVMVDQRELHRALRLYVHNIGYLRALRAGVDRIDLDGNAVGTVTAEQAQSAAEELARRGHKVPAKSSPSPKVVSINTTSTRITLADLRAAGARRRQAVTS
jgi:sRNA-binding protein